MINATFTTTASSTGEAIKTIFNILFEQVGIRSGDGIIVTDAQFTSDFILLTQHNSGEPVCYWLYNYKTQELSCYDEKPAAPPMEA